MQITVTLEDKEPEDLFAQHLAEQTDFGHVEDWLYGLMYTAFRAHPDYRECSDHEKCCLIVYPTFHVRPVLDDNWKHYRIATSPTETCPACGSPTVPLVPVSPNAGVLAMQADFAAGQSGIPEIVRQACTEEAKPTNPCGVKEAASYLHVSKVTVYRLVAAGRLRHQKKGGKLWFKLAWLDEYNERTTFSPITARTKVTRS